MSVMARGRRHRVAVGLLATLAATSVGLVVSGGPALASGVGSGSTRVALGASVPPAAAGESSAARHVVRSEAALRARRVPTRPRTRAARTRPGLRFLVPAAGPITSGFGWRVHPIFHDRRFHSGIDIGARVGAPVWAAADGVVVVAGADSGYGNTVVIEHGGGLTTLYGHQRRIAVRPGTRVRAGELLGYVGTTGYSTGPHLHFEVRVRGVPVNPRAYL